MIPCKGLPILPLSYSCSKLGLRALQVVLLISFTLDLIHINSCGPWLKIVADKNERNMGYQQKIGIPGFFQFPLVSFSAKYLQGPQKSHWEWNHNSGCRRSLQQQYTPTQHRPAPLIRKAAGSGMVIIKVQVVHSVGRKMIPYLIDFLMELNNILKHDIIFTFQTFRTWPCTLSSIKSLAFDRIAFN